MTQTCRAKSPFAGRYRFQPRLITHVLWSFQRERFHCLPRTISEPSASAKSRLQGGILWERGLFDEADPPFSEAYEGFLQSGDPMNACTSAFSFVSWLAWRRGKLHRAAELHQQPIRLAGQSPASIYAHDGARHVLPL